MNGWRTLGKVKTFCSFAVRHPVQASVAVAIFVIVSVIGWIVPDTEELYELERVYE